MNLSKLFDVFSRRSESTQPTPRQLTGSFRNRVLMICRDTFGEAGLQREFWADIHKKLQYLHGRPRLSTHPDADTSYGDTIAFVTSCEDEHFLDFVEYIFRVECYWRVFPEENDLVDKINAVIRVDDLPYFVTKFARETRKEPGEFGVGRQSTVSVLVAHPKVVRRDNQVVHEFAIQPTLDLLTAESFSSANLEFREALEDYRKADYGDCLTKCGSAFESVMKLVCDRKGWPYQQSDTAATLVRNVVSHSNLPPFFEQTLLIVATLRNKLSKSHGAGTLERDVPEHVAQYGINATATAILLVMNECL